MLGEWNFGTTAAYHQWTVNVSEWSDGTSLILAESEEFFPGMYHALEIDGRGKITFDQVNHEIENVMDVMFDAYEDGIY